VTTSTDSRRAVHPVDEVLPPDRLVAYGLQHVMTMYAGIVAVPLIVATAVEVPPDQLIYLINAAFFMCGVATLIQAIGFPKVGVRLPIVQGTTFAAVTPLILIGQEGGLEAMFGAVIAGGVVTVILAPFFSKLLHFFPPVVTGSVITIIGVSLMPVAIRWAGGGVVDDPGFGSLGNVALAFLVLVVILALYRFFSGFVGRVAILLGLVVGTVFATLLGVADYGRVGDASWFEVTTPFYFGLPTFGLVAVVSMTLVMLVVMVETTSDIIAIGEIVEKPIGPENLAAGLRADGVSTALGGIFNSFPFTAFAQNVGLVRFSNVKSRFVVAAAGGILIVLGLFPKLAAVVASIPLPVLGGAGLVLFGSVAAVGIQTLSRVDFGDNRNLVIVAVSIALGVIPATVPSFYDKFPEGFRIVFESGITSASVAAIVLNILFNVLGGKRNLVDEVVPTERVAERVTLVEVNGMSRDEFVRRFGPLVQGPDWVAEEAYARRPFDSLYDLRHAFQDALFDAPPERQLELIRSYPDLGTSDGALGPESRRDQASAGLDRLSPEESEELGRMNAEFRERFGFPPIFAVRENTKETILAGARARLENSPAQERATALVEVAKIANLRLLDLVAAPSEGPVALGRR
jgi:OHCU decarboxylase